MADPLSSLASITAAISTIQVEDIQNEERAKLISAIEKLRTSLETPEEKIQRLSYGHFVSACIRVAQGMGVFDAFSQSASSEITLSELSAKTKGDESLLYRIMRFLHAQNMFEDIGTETPTYKASPIALALANGTTSGETFKHVENLSPISAGLAAYFEKTNYQNPSNAYNGPLQFGLNTKDHYFDWLARNPEAQSAFNTVMGNRRGMQKNWFEMYPVLERFNYTETVAEGKGEKDRVLLVDVGGNEGHELVAFRKRFPNLQGRLILQDIPSVVEGITAPLGENIDIVKYNMLDPQPIKAAKAYYMRTVLLDWPDKQALQILANIRESMAPDSVLLVQDLIYPDRNAPVNPLSAVLDFMMMECFSALQRTEAEWVGLFEMAGFVVRNVYRPEGQAFLPVALFEAVLSHNSE
ncbi:hypothetical protein ASPSYDRAFT_205904 [Aspergillus sydowii CBS 593.65]|uniref:Uncharacterized protein n=1 Tax=Aspergillus sydowii CBS 593.65 TaxID=1036612 RepID=A0A1L9TC28_9EURO|nr:uncharacterized protein ASPSYDRAFT_205904 [Aspergillus sydowii CBS 593.65]OJJ56961.1 hypothetical protein ASPSYDRAFT_205904 [Aspergillus sydowii CBS 593.65]